MQMANTKQLAKSPAFGVPSAEAVERMDNSDRVQALRAAGYRYETRT
jgi:hypothetical protein